MNVLEATSTVIGVIVVLCLIYEKHWAWPLGVLFCFLSAPVLWHSNLYGYLTLTLVGFLPLNLYGWYYWLFGTEDKDELPVVKASFTTLILVALICAAGVFALPYFFAFIVTDYFETAEYIYLDNAILVLSLCAMWMTARKMIENWVLWFIVNVGTVVLYGLTSLWFLVILYVAYIGMAVWGFYMWSQSLQSQHTDESTGS